MKTSLFSEQQIAFIMSRPKIGRPSRRFAERPGYLSRCTIDGAANMAIIMYANRILRALVRSFGIARSAILRRGTIRGIQLRYLVIDAY